MSESSGTGSSMEEVGAPASVKSPTASAPIRPHDDISSDEVEIIENEVERPLVFPPFDPKILDQIITKSDKKKENESESNSTENDPSSTSAEAEADDEVDVLAFSLPKELRKKQSSSSSDKSKSPSKSKSSSLKSSPKESNSKTPSSPSKSKSKSTSSKNGESKKKSTSEKSKKFSKDKDKSNKKPSSSKKPISLLTRFDASVIEQEIHPKTDQVISHSEGFCHLLSNFSKNDFPIPEPASALSLVEAAHLLDLAPFIQYSNANPSMLRFIKSNLQSAATICPSNCTISQLESAILRSSSTIPTMAHFCLAARQTLHLNLFFASNSSSNPPISYVRDSFHNFASADPAELRRDCQKFDNILPITRSQLESLILDPQSETNLPVFSELFSKILWSVRTQAGFESPTYSRLFAMLGHVAKKKKISNEQQICFDYETINNWLFWLLDIWIALGEARINALPTDTSTDESQNPSSSMEEAPTEPPSAPSSSPTPAIDISIKDEPAEPLSKAPDSSIVYDPDEEEEKESEADQAAFQFNVPEDRSWSAIEVYHAFGGANPLAVPFEPLHIKSEPNSSSLSLEDWASKIPVATLTSSTESFPVPRRRAFHQLPLVFRLAIIRLLLDFQTQNHPRLHEIIKYYADRGVLPLSAPVPAATTSKESPNPAPFHSYLFAPRAINLGMDGFGRSFFWFGYGDGQIYASCYQSISNAVLGEPRLNLKRSFAAFQAQSDTPELLDALTKLPQGTSGMSDSTLQDKINKWYEEAEYDLAPLCDSNPQFYNLKLELASELQKQLAAKLAGKSKSSPKKEQQGSPSKKPKTSSNKSASQKSLLSFFSPIAKDTNHTASTTASEESENFPAKPESSDSVVILSSPTFVQPSAPAGFSFIPYTEDESELFRVSDKPILLYQNKFSEVPSEYLLCQVTSSLDELSQLIKLLKQSGKSRFNPSAKPDPTLPNSRPVFSIPHPRTTEVVAKLQKILDLSNLQTAPVEIISDAEKTSRLIKEIQNEEEEEEMVNERSLRPRISSRLAALEQAKEEANLVATLALQNASAATANAFKRSTWLEQISHRAIKSLRKTAYSIRGKILVFGTEYNPTQRKARASPDPEEAQSEGRSRPRRNARTEMDEDMEEDDSMPDDGCSLCGRKNGSTANPILLCDGPKCTYQICMKCHDRTLTSIPESDFFCPAHSNRRTRRK